MRTFGTTLIIRINTKISKVFIRVYSCNSLTHSSFLRNGDQKA